MAKKKTGKAASKDKRAKQKEKDKKKAPSSSSSSSSKNTSSSGRYETTDGKKFSDKNDASAHQKKLNASGKGKGSSFDVNLKTTPAKEEKKEKEKEKEDNSDYERADDTELRNSPEFKALSGEDQESVLAVFDAVASNDSKKANRLAKAFEAASKINDPYFAQQLRLARDAVVRGYQSITDEADFAERQAKTRLQDLRKDFETRKEFLTVEEATQIKAIDRQYETDLEDTRQNLAANGFTSSSRRVQKEKILDEATGDIRSSTRRKFAFEMTGDEDNIQSSERDTNRELGRLAELTKAGKLEFLRKAEEQLGSKNLPRLAGAPDALGGIYGDLPEQKLKNTIDAAMGFVF